MRFITAIGVLAILAGHAFAQISVEEATRRLQEKQRARTTQPASAPASAKVEQNDLKQILTGLTKRANEAISDPTSGMTKAQLSKAMKDRDEAIASLQPELLNKAVSCRVTITDVRQVGTQYLATGIFELPVPSEVEQAWRSEIASTNRRYEEQISKLRSDLQKAPPTQDPHYIQERTSKDQSKINALERERETKLKLLRKTQHQGEARVQLLGSDALLRWNRGDVQSVAQAVVTSVKFHRTQGNHREWGDVGKMPNGWEGIDHVDVCATIIGKEGGILHDSRGGP